MNKWAVVFICYEEQRKEDGQRIQAWLLWWPFLPKPILASWAEAEENGSRNCQRRSVRCSLRRLLQEPLWSSLSMKRIQFWCISSMKQLVFHVWRDAVVSNVTRVDLHRFLNTAMSLWCGFCRYWRRPSLVFDKILQSFNWQRQDSLLSTQSPCQDKPKAKLARSQVARTLSWELVPSRPVGPESKECFICKSSYLRWLWCHGHPSL